MDTPQAPDAGRDVPVNEDPALTRALEGLVAEGVLTPEQVGRVTAARDQEAAKELIANPGATRPGVAPAPRPPGGGRLPEVLGYLGGTFVVAAALLVTGLSWDSFSHGTRIGLTAAAALVVYGAGLAIGLGAAGGRATLPRPDQDVRRRLVGVLLVVGSFLAAGAVALIGEDSTEAQLVPIALTALVLTLVAVRLAPGAAPTLGLFAATVLLAFSPESLSVFVPTLTWVLIFLGLGLVWVVAGPWITGTPTAALAVGLADLFVVGWVAAAHSGYDGIVAEWGEDLVAPLGNATLVVLVVLGVAVYLRGHPWPWLAAATAAAAVLVFQVAGDAFGPAVAALVLGALLLAASGLLIVRRGRAETRAGAREDVQVGGRP